MAYISKIQIDDGSIVPIGSNLYGICESSASSSTKVVVSSDFNATNTGVTIHVKFTNGNSAAANDSLTLGFKATSDGEYTVGPYKISVPSGNASWSAGSVISFTLDGSVSPYTWIANDSDSANSSMTILHTYSSTSTEAISGQGVAAALNSLQLGAAAKKGVVTGIVESGTGANKTSTDLPTTNAVTAYIDSKMSGLTSAMHFKGAVNAVPTNNENYSAGDVIIISSTNKEYVFNGTSWIELGDEGSYVLKSSVDMTGSVGSASGWNAGSAPTLGDAIPADDITSWSQGTLPTLGDAISVEEVVSWDDGDAASFNVNNGVLVITSGSAPTLTHSSKSIPNVTGVGTLPTLEYTAKSIPNVTNVGSVPTLSITSVAVVVPVAT